MASQWGSPHKDTLADLLEQLGVEEPEWEQERSIEPLLRVFQWLGLAVIVAGGMLGYLGIVPVWEGVGAIFCGGAAAFAAEIVRKGL